MWNTVLLCKNFTYLCFSIPQLFPTKVFLLHPCCGSSCSVHPTLVYVHTPKKSISRYQPFSSNIKKRKQATDVLSTKLHDTLAHTAGKNKMIWFWLSVGETRPCTLVQHGVTETISTYLNAFVCSAVVGRVCQCKISAKCGCSVTTALYCECKIWTVQNKTVQILWHVSCRESKHSKYHTAWLRDRYK